jgi:hypothetical protein
MVRSVRIPYVFLILLLFPLLAVQAQDVDGFWSTIQERIDQKE